MAPLDPTAKDDRPPGAVTVVIPSRDRHAELARAISAADGQLGVAVEIVIVDDGSRIPVRLAAESENCFVVRLDTSRGVAAARNIGITAARNEWIAFLDDDDIWAPERLERMLQAAASAQAEVVCSATIVLDERGRPRSVYPVPTLASLARDLRGANVIGGPSGVMARRELLMRAGGFDGGLSVLADWDLWIRLADLARFAVWPDVLTGYVVHDGSMHLRHIDTAVSEFALMGRRYGVARRSSERGMWDGNFNRWAASAYRVGGRRRRAAALYWRNWRRHRVPRDLLRIGAALLGGSTLKRLTSRDATSLEAPPWVALYQDAPGGPLRPMRGSAREPQVDAA